jgi:McbB family protein
MFIVRPFVIYNAASSYYCYSNQTSAKITNDNLLQLLQHLLQEKTHELTKQELEQLAAQYNLNGDVVRRFLVESLRILSSKNEERFQYLYIMSDNHYIQQALSDEFSRHYGLTVIPKMDFSPITTEKSLIVFFNQEYKEHEFKKLYSLSNHSDSYFVTSFLVDNYLIIDNIYNKNKGTPCHFCGTNQLRATTLTSPDISYFNWLVFYRQLLKGGFVSFPAAPMSMLSRALTTYSLGKFVKQFIDPFGRELYQDNISEFWHVNLDKNKVEKESAMHWHLCECYHDS